MKTKMECFHNIFLDEYKSKNDKTSKIWKNIQYFLILIQILFQILFHCQNDNNLSQNKTKGGQIMSNFTNMSHFFMTMILFLVFVSDAKVKILINKDLI